MKLKRLFTAVLSAALALSLLRHARNGGRRHDDACQDEHQHD